MRALQQTAGFLRGCCSMWESISDTAFFDSTAARRRHLPRQVTWLRAKCHIAMLESKDDVVAGTPERAVLCVQTLAHGSSLPRAECSLYTDTTRHSQHYRALETSYDALDAHSLLPPCPSYITRPARRLLFLLLIHTNHPTNAPLTFPTNHPETPTTSNNVGRRTPEVCLLSRSSSLLLLQQLTSQPR